MYSKTTRHAMKKYILLSIFLKYRHAILIFFTYLMSDKNLDAVKIIYKKSSPFRDNIGLTYFVETIKSMVTVPIDTTSEVFTHPNIIIKNSEIKCNTKCK